jgi:hypothetical protein
LVAICNLPRALPTFVDANDLYSRIGRVMQELASDPELLPVFLEADTCVRYELRDPDSAITVGCRDGAPVRVEFGPSEQEPEVVISMDADVAHSYLLGELDMTVALARGQMTADGPVTKILAVLPIFEPLLPRYRAFVSGSNGRGSARAMKLLVLASDPVGADDVRRALPGDDDISDAEVLVVAPAVNESPVRFWMSDADAAIERAGDTAGETAGELRSEGAHARARTGEGEPLVALQDALTTFPADRVLVFVREGDAARYREEDVIGEAERRFGVPVTEVTH